MEVTQLRRVPAVLTTYLGFTYHTWALAKWGRFIRVSSWFPSVWFIYYAAVWFSGFGSLYLTYLVPSQYTRRGSLTGVRKHASPVLLNGLCFGVPILCAVTILPLQVKQSFGLRATLRGARSLNTILGSLSLAWNASPNPETTLAFDGVKAATERALAAKDTWLALWTAEMALWSFWSLLALAVSQHDSCSSGYLLTIVHRPQYLFVSVWSCRRIAGSEEWPSHNLL